MVVALLGVQCGGLGVVMNCVLIVPVGQVCMMRRLFVLLGLVVFRCLFIVVGRLLMVTGSVMIVLPSL